MPQIAPDELVTPCYLTLPPGEYMLELTNGTTTVTDKITVSATRPNEFRYPLGQYEPRNIAAEVLGKK